MLCPSCQQDKHPVIEGDQSGRFVYTCGNAGCHANLGPVKAGDSAATPAAAIPPPTVAPPRVSVTIAPAAAVVEQLRARLAYVEREIEARATLDGERAQLRRMLAAAERKPRARRALSNVVPIATRTSS